MTKIPPSAQVLIDFKPSQSFFVGIDSDGCAFDAMELKQKECFTPSTIRVWGLQPSSKYARETAEWVNLYSNPSHSHLSRQIADFTICNLQLEEG